MFGLVSESPTEAQIRGRVASLTEYLNYIGGVVVLYIHNGAEDYDWPAASANWDYLFDQLSKSNVMVKTFKDAMTYISANAESTSGSGGELAYTRSAGHLGDASNYRIKGGSPLANAGVNPCTASGVPLVCCTGAGTSSGCVDLAGRPAPVGAWDIGPYESRKVPMRAGNSWVPRHQP